MYYLSKNPSTQKKLQEELDATFGPRGIEGVLEYEDVKALPYLDACINEALRLHSTSAMGLPRVMTRPTEFDGEVFPPGVRSAFPMPLLTRIGLTSSSLSNDRPSSRSLRTRSTGSKRFGATTPRSTAPSVGSSRRRRRASSRRPSSESWRTGNEQKKRRSKKRQRKADMGRSVFPQHLLVRTAFVRWPQRRHDGAVLLHLDPRESSFPLMINCRGRSGN